MAEKKEQFYKDAKKYWSEVPATVDGMLGGFSHISSTDIAGSTKFLNKFIKYPGLTGHQRAIDCGAGIGRITKRLLLKLFENVDMVELNQDFLNEAEEYLGEESSRIEKYICCGLQDFVPEEGRYDVVWSQWVLGHLTDEDLVTYLKRSRKGLNENGIIVIKENFTNSETPDFDENDSSFTRNRQEFVELIHKAELKIILEEKQQHFPKDIYEVRMLALR